MAPLVAAVAAFLVAAAPYANDASALANSVKAVQGLACSFATGIAGSQPAFCKTTTAMPTAARAPATINTAIPDGTQPPR